MKKMIYMGIFVGSTVGGYIPALWGAGLFSAWSLILGALGSFAGIWGGYKLGQYLGM